MDTFPSIRTIITFMVIAFLPTHVFAHDETVDLNKLYQSGKLSYENKDYVKCIKSLTVFKIHASEYLKNNPNIAQGVDERFQICEQKLTQAINYYNSRGIAVSPPVSSGAGIFNGSNAPGSFGSFGGAGRVVQP